MTDFKDIISRVAEGETLDVSQTQFAFNHLMSGEAEPSQIAALLVGLRVRGETQDEFVGAINAMRTKMLPVDAPDDAIDIVGTGGDSKGSLNISTATALVVASTGIKVAKHGNRALSSKSGAADTLIELGVNLDLSPSQISDCIEDANIGFMFAPNHHSAMRHVGPVRVELGIRTIFNLLGPMCNPAGVKRQLLGVYSPKWSLIMAKVLAELGSQKVWVVHGEGFDEITITGTTQAAMLDNGSIKVRDIAPKDFGFDIQPESAIAGDDAVYNAKALLRLLDGEKSAYRDMVLMNAAASLVIADKADDLLDGVSIAAKAIDNGDTSATLKKLVATSNMGNS